jgi:dynein heavy chain
MSDELDDMFYDLLANKVPKNWKKVSYPSLKPMSSWMKDLK